MDEWNKEFMFMFRVRFDEKGVVIVLRGKVK